MQPVPDLKPGSMARDGPRLTKNMTHSAVKLDSRGLRADAERQRGVLFPAEMAEARELLRSPPETKEGP